MSYISKHQQDSCILGVDKPLQALGVTEKWDGADVPWSKMTERTWHASCKEVGEFALSLCPPHSVCHSLPFPFLVVNVRLKVEGMRGEVNTEDPHQSHVCP